MSRIRTIKPDAFKSESLSSVPRGARWTFAGLFTYVDDEGLGRADVRLIKAELYPLDDATTAAVVDEDLSALIDAGCVHTYQSGGKVYLHIPEFLRHQRVSHPTKSVLPPCSCTVSEPSGMTEPDHDSGAAPEDARATREASALKGREGKGKGIEGEGEKRDRATPNRPPRSCAKHPNGTDDPCGPCADARKTAAAWRPPTFTPKTMCGDHPKRPALNCPDCASQTFGPDADVLAKIKALAKRKTA